MIGSLVLFKYRQPRSGSAVRFGAVSHVRDTKKDPLRTQTVHGRYRERDWRFERSQVLATVHTLRTVRQFYAERVEWAIVVPFAGYPMLWAKSAAQRVRYWFRRRKRGQIISIPRSA